MSAVVFVGSGVLYWDYNHQFVSNVGHGSKINHAPSALPHSGGVTTPPPSGSTSPSSTPSDIDGKSQNILIVGNDSRQTLTPAQLAEVGTDANPGLNTDTIMILHVPADGTQASIISIPRDSYVDIPGGFKKDKVNAAYADGVCYDASGHSRNCTGHISSQQDGDGMNLLVATLQNLTGLHIDHYVEVSLLAFFHISNTLGGVTVCLADRWYDPVYEKGIDYPPGNITLKGKLALAFVRERHTLPHGDFDRIRRQQAFVSAIIRKLTSGSTLLHLGRISSLLQQTASSLTLDAGFDPNDLVKQLANITPGNIRLTTIPTAGGATTASGADVVTVVPSVVQAFVKKVIGLPATPASSTPPTPTPSSPATTGAPSTASGSSAPPSSTSSDPAITNAAKAGCVD